jgi:intracellular septation protein
MKLLLDFLPIVLFFASFKFAEAHRGAAADFATRYLGGLVSGGGVGPAEAPVLLATVVVIVATVAQVAMLKLRGRRVDTMLWVSLALVVVFGGATVWFHDETFIKWKPSVLYWTMGAALALAPWLFGRNLIKSLLGEQLQLPEPVWGRLNLAWAVFFALMGLVNLWVAYRFSTETWVTFKLFGALGLTLAFAIAQALVLSRYAKDDDAADMQRAAANPAELPPGRNQ